MPFKNIAVHILVIAAAHGFLEVRHVGAVWLPGVWTYFISCANSPSSPL